ncbi:MAG: GNAT family N-acetyltransferase [Pseudonocardiaceae bacterium]
MIEWVCAQSAPPGYRFVVGWCVQAGWLVCQRPELGEDQDLYEAVMVSLDHLRPWMPWARGYTPRVAAEFIERHSGQAAAPVDDAPYVIRDRRGVLLGVCGLHARLGAHRLEIGYWVGVRHTRRGVATLACAALTESAMTIPELTVVEIHHDQANLASAAIPAKLGYQHVATCRGTPEAPGEIGIEWQWRMSRASWLNSPGAQLLAAARLTTS